MGKKKLSNEQQEVWDRLTYDPVLVDFDGGLFYCPYVPIIKSIDVTLTYNVVDNDKEDE